MQLAQTAWQYEDVEHYEMNTVRNEVAIGEEVFQLSKDTQYFSQGHSIEKMDLNPADILTFHGIDSTVLSVTVEKAMDTSDWSMMRTLWAAGWKSARHRSYGSQRTCW